MIYESKTIAPGLKWKQMGLHKPTKGQEIQNEALAAKLQQQHEFTKEEWDGFQVDRISFDSFVKVGDSYFKPLKDVEWTGSLPFVVIT